MDPLTEIVGALRVQAALFTRIEARSPWGWASLGHWGIKFVLVVRGAGVLVLPSQPAPISLRGGDVFIMLDDTPYQLFDQTNSETVDCVEIEERRVGTLIEVGGDGALTTFVSGVFEIGTEDAMPLFSVLPRFLLLKGEEGRTRAFESVLELLAMEIAQPGLGYEAMTSGLFELLFVHAVRAYAAQSGVPKNGWLAASSDKMLAEPVRAMHEDLARGWTVDSLARLAGMSRSAFSLKFKSVTGQTPLEYLTRWRMHKASLLIRRNTLSLSQIAAEVGYQSDAAFNRVFKREIGVTPGYLRRNMIEHSPLGSPAERAMGAGPTPQSSPIEDPRRRLR